MRNIRENKMRALMLLAAIAVALTGACILISSNLETKGEWDGKLFSGFQFSEGDFVDYVTGGEAMGCIVSSPLRMKVTDVSENGFTLNLTSCVSGDNLARLSLENYVFIRAGVYNMSDSLFFPELAGKWKFDGKENVKSVNGNVEEVILYRYENLTVFVDEETGIPVQVELLMEENIGSSGIDYVKFIEIDNSNVNLLKN